MKSVKELDFFLESRDLVALDEQLALVVGVVQSVYQLTFDDFIGEASAYVQVLSARVTAFVVDEELASWRVGLEAGDKGLRVFALSLDAIEEIRAVLCDHDFVYGCILYGR